MDDWKKHIGIAFLVKKEVASVDEQGLWPLHLPEVAATNEAICEIESKIGQPLDCRYREFLTYANGWKGFFQSIDLLGTEDLKGTPLLQRACELIDSLEPLDALIGIDREHCFPIAVSTDSVDVVFVATAGSGDAGAVYWFAGQLIDRFVSFDEFFLAMVDYNRAEFEALRGAREAAGQ
jgi:hypothetical protein